MKCADVKEQMVDFLYGELSARDRAVFDEHARTCAACRAEIESHQRTLGQARQALAGPLAQEPPARVHVAVLAAATQAARRTARASDNEQPGFLARFWRTPWFLPAFGAVSVATVVFLVRVLKNPEVMPGQRPRPVDEIHLAPAGGPTPRAVPAEPAAAAPAPGGAPAGATGKSAIREPRLEATGKRASIPAETQAARKRKASGAPPPFLGDSDKGAGAGFAQPPRPATRSSRDLDDMLKAAAPRPAAKKALESAPPSAAKDEVPGSESANQPMARPREYATPPPARLAAPKPAAPAPAVAAPPPSPSYAPAPAAEAAPAERSAKESVATQSKAKADHGAAQPLPFLDDSLRKAERLFAAGNWSGAAAAYRELLRRFPTHEDAPRWRQRIDQAVLAEERDRRADEAKAAKAHRP